MTAARSTQIDLDKTPFYHCMTRCVRQSYLCGTDLETGRDYSHRKPWIVGRIKQLTEVFAINVCAYAVMSNHYHLVLFVNQHQAEKWSEEEVVARWEKIFPIDAKSLDLYSKSDAKKKIAKWRFRLMEISWLMRCLNETIARFSNKEDEKKGRFWEGRFKCQALLDEGAVLSAMAYVDLNPIRAGLASTPEKSDFTSIQERLRMVVNQMQDQKKNSPKLSLKEIEQHCDKTKQPEFLMPFANGLEYNTTPVIDFKFSDYLKLVDSTGRIIKENKRGAIPADIAPILERLYLNPKTWINMVENLQSNFSYAIGHTMILMDFGSQYRTHGPKGISTARKSYLNAA